jgi:CRISPR system Cascade subunit CasA
MNVAFDPWIPVVNASGEPELASLHGVLAKGEDYADLSVRAHERVALMRLFLCVAHAALNGPKDYVEWCEVPQKLSAAVSDYLALWKDSFELFHKDKPWLQVADLTGVKKQTGESKSTSPVALLDFELATGNNSTLFDHSGQMPSRHLTPERIALSLLTFQNFSSGGGAPIAQWHTVRTSQVGNPDAPCLSQSMVHCLLRGKSIAETILLNLPTFENIGQVYRCCFFDSKKGDTYAHIGLGKPVWEFFPDSPDSTSPRALNATQSYLGRLTPISRWIRLIEGADQMYCCNGFKYQTFKDGFAAEPTAVVHLVTKKAKKAAETTERRVVRIEPIKALWRELSSLLVKRSAEGIGGPLAMANAPYDTGFDLHVCGVARDQASIEIAMESVFHISPAFLIHLPVYQAEIAGDSKVMGAEGYARKLQWALEDYRQAIDADWKPRIKRTQARDQAALKDKLAQGASLSYWTRVEKNLSLLMNHIEAIGTEDAVPTQQAWRRMLFSAATDAYRTVCGRETPRHMRAFAKGWEKLTRKRTRPDATAHDTEEEKE